MGDGVVDVTVVAPPGSTLGAALGAALLARAWQVDEVRSLRPATAHLRGRAVVLLEDDAGAPVVHMAPGVPLRTCVCVGSTRSVRELQDLHRRGAVVLDQSAPLLPLLRILEHHLRTAGRTRPPDPDVAAGLRRRQDEYAAMTRLSAAEVSVLALLTHGVGAAQIGAHRHLSLNTVRTHIRSILSKLGVRSQLEAVAVARRVGEGAWLVDAQVEFTNSGEDPTHARGGR